jgi:hypothetical protein
VSGRPCPWGCEGQCQYQVAANESLRTRTIRAAARESRSLSGADAQAIEGALARAERFARLWKRMAKTLMDRSWYQHGHKHGVAAERARIVAWLRGQLDEDHGYSATTCSFLRITAAHIEAGEHLRGESEVAPRHAVNEHGDCAVWCHGCDWRKSRGLPLDWDLRGESEGG